MSKKGLLLISIMLFVSTGLNAATAGAYFGGGIGASSLMEVGSMDDLNLAGRAFAGYNFNPNFGLEINYASLLKTSFVLSNYPYSDINVDFKLSALTLVGKGYVFAPPSHPFNLFCLFGGALVNNNVTATDGYTTITDSVSNFMPTVGLGFSYDINKYITTNIEFSGFLGTKKGTSTHFGIPESTLTTFNLAYKL